MEGVLGEDLLCWSCKDLKISSTSDLSVSHTLGVKERQSWSFSCLPVESMKGPSFILLTGEDSEVVAWNERMSAGDIVSGQTYTNGIWIVSCLFMVYIPIFNQPDCCKNSPLKSSCSLLPFHSGLEPEALCPMWGRSTGDTYCCSTSSPHASRASCYACGVPVSSVLARLTPEILMVQVWRGLWRNSNPVSFLGSHTNLCTKE